MSEKRLGIAKQNLTMDLTAVHANGNPLRLAALLAADDFNFAHDVYGIQQHINRNTAKLENHFSPRFSMPDPGYFKRRAEQTGKTIAELRRQARGPGRLA
jgi:hypothetical protein